MIHMPETEALIPLSDLAIQRLADRDGSFAADTERPRGVIDCLKSLAEDH